MLIWKKITHNREDIETCSLLATSVALCCNIKLLSPLTLDLYQQFRMFSEFEFFCDTYDDFFVFFWFTIFPSTRLIYIYIRAAFPRMTKCELSAFNQTWVYTCIQLTALPSSQYQMHCFHNVHCKRSEVFSGTEAKSWHLAVTLAQCSKCIVSCYVVSQRKTEKKHKNVLATMIKIDFFKLFYYFSKLAGVSKQRYVDKKQDFYGHLVWKPVKYKNNHTDLTLLMSHFISLSVFPLDPKHHHIHPR